MTDAPGSPPRPAAPPAADVTVVVVTRGPTDHLRTTLAAVSGQTRPPQRVLLVDAASDDDADPAGLTELITSVHPPGAEPASGPAVEVVRAPGARTFGQAVRAGLAQADDAPSADGRGPAWLWLLHDDSAPAPDALAELLGAVEIAPSVAIAGCKQHTWSDPVRVLEVGVSTSRFGRRMTGLDGPEVDQGQHDGREDVLGVGIAGALVRRDVWDELGGTDPALGPYGDGLDLSRRARLAGHRVIVVPGAVVRHARTSLGNRPGWDRRRSVQARREAYLHTQLTGVPLPLVPVVVLLAVASGVVRALGRFVTKEPHLVLAELAAPWGVLLRPGRLVAARRNASRTRRLPRRTLRPLQVTWREVVAQARDRRLTAAEQRRTRSAPSELELREMAVLRTRRRAGLAVVVLVTAGLTVLLFGPLIVRVVAGDRLTGGTLELGDTGVTGLWSALTSGWVPGGLGAAGPPDPLLTALLPFTALTGTLGNAVALVLLGSLVLSGVGAWYAAGAATRSVTLRGWAALVWTAAPALLVALDQVRLGAVLAHVALPWVLLGTARAIGVARVDAVESGLVQGRTDGGAPEVLRAVRTADPSLAAAAGAGLAFVVVVVGAPVLLPFGLLALLGVAAFARRRGHLAWVAVPSLALQGPVLTEAISRWDEGGWRLLSADPGTPVGSGAPVPGWQYLLGLPDAPTSWVDLPEPYATVVPWTVVGVVALVALLALAVPGRVGRAVRVGWLLAAVGVVAAVVAARVEVGVGTDAVLVTAWPGSAVSLVLAGLLVAALAGAVGVREAMARYSFGWRQVCAGAVGLVAVLGPAAGLGAWSWHVRDDGPAPELSQVPVVPAVGRQMQSEYARVLHVTIDRTGEVHATLMRDDGVQLTERSRSVEARRVAGPVGGAVAVPPDVADVELAQVAARLVTGTGQTVAEDLAALGVAAVLVPPGVVEGSSGSGVADGADVSGVSGVSGGAGGSVAGADARARLVGVVDSTPGLDRVTSTESGILWRVGVEGHVGGASWARLVEAGSGSEGALIDAVPARDGRIDTRVPASDVSRLLVLAERADPGWRATLDGVRLRTVETTWRQAFEVGAEGGHLVVEHAAPGQRPWLVLQGVVLLVTVLLALPVRRRRGVGR